MVLDAMFDAADDVVGHHEEPGRPRLPLAQVDRREETVGGEERDHELFIGGEAMLTFVAVRDRRARELRAAGGLERAAAVRALPKPTLVARGLDRASRELGSLAIHFDELAGRLARSARRAIGDGGKGAGDLTAAIQTVAASDRLARELLERVDDTRAR